MANTLAKVATRALSHLGVHTRPLSVDQYGGDECPTYRVSCDGENGVCVLTCQGESEFTVVRGTPPTPDVIPATVVAAHARAVMAEFAAHRKSESDPLVRAAEIEAAMAVLPPVVAAAIYGSVKAAGPSVFCSYGVWDDPRCYDAAESAWDRIVGRKSGTVATAEERKANRDRSEAAQAVLDAEADAVAAEYAAERGSVLATALARVRLVRAGKMRDRGSIRRLQDAVEKSRAEIGRTQPYLRTRGDDASPYACGAGSLDTLHGDWSRWAAGERRLIAAAVALLAE